MTNLHLTGGKDRGIVVANDFAQGPVVKEADKGCTCAVPKHEPAAGGLHRASQKHGGEATEVLHRASQKHGGEANQAPLCAATKHKAKAEASKLTDYVLGLVNQTAEETRLATRTQNALNAPTISRI